MEVKTRWCEGKGAPLHTEGSSPELACSLQLCPSSGAATRRAWLWEAAGVQSSRAAEAGRPLSPHLPAIMPRQPALSPPPEVPNSVSRRESYFHTYLSNHQRQQVDSLKCTCKHISYKHSIPLHMQMQSIGTKMICIMVKEEGIFYNVAFGVKT